MIVYFGGLRGVLKEYIKYGYKIFWVIREYDYVLSDSEINVNKIILSKLNVDEVLCFLTKHKFKKNIHCVSYHDDYHDIAVEISARLGGSCNIKSNSNLISKNKTLSRDLSNKIFDIFIKFHEKKEDSTIDHILNMSFPIISKPINGTGSKDIKLLQNKHELELLFEKLTTSTLFEEYIHGVEFSVDSISKDGIHKVLMIAEKRLFDGTFVEKSHLIGTKKSKEIWFIVEKKVTAYLNAIGYIDGMSHIEVKILDDKISFIECQLRMGGDYLWEAYNIITGSSLVDLSFKSDQDENFEISELKTTLHSDEIVIIEFFSWNIESGNLLYWSGIEEAENIDGVYLIKTMDNIDICKHPVSSSRDRDLVIILKGNDFEKMELDKNKVIEKIRPVVKIKVKSEEL
ncbi:ATP-grasp domain-containing protein [Photorhabdus viridis]|uniref:ATP-grasp domain-containing protein n=1 Tax=Photorhabdus viridis TaxID=3163327 RepID=UPI003306C822